MDKRRSGQSTAEYAILIAVVIAGMVGMQVYVKRGLQARYKVVSDRFTAGGEGQTIGDVPLQHTVDQYEPYYASQDVGVTQNKTESEEYTTEGTIQRTVAAGADETRRGTVGGGTGTRTQGVDQNSDTNWGQNQ